MTSNTLAPPTPLHALRELGLPLEIARSVARSPSPLGSPRGHGEPVIVLYLIGFMYLLITRL